MYLLPGLIPEIVTVFASQVQCAFAGTLLYSKIAPEMISEGLEIQHFPDTSPLGGVFVHIHCSNQYVNYLFNNLRTGLINVKDFNSLHNEQRSTMSNLL